MEVRMRKGLLAALFVVVAIPVAAQNLIIPPPAPRMVNLSGPRFGVTSLSDGVVKKLLDERSIVVPPTITQIGWQAEKAFYTHDSGTAVVTEWVGLLGGLEHSMVIPSLTWLVGMRTANGAEFGVGPNVTPAGVGLAFAAGVTIRSGFLNVPVNVAVVPSAAGMRISMLTGFNWRH
jgi:hypothetical protein